MKRKGKRPYKRRHYFVKKELQLSFILRFFILALTSSIIVNIALYILLNKKIEETFYSAHISVKTSGEIIRPVLILINFIIVPVVILISIRLIKSYTNKISGPLLRFQRTIGEIAQGNLSLKINLRKGDQLFELQDKFNFMIDSLKGKIEDIKFSFNQLRKSEKIIDELMVERPMNIEKVREQIDLFFQDIKKLGEETKVFKF
ncbi:MAG: HAMP domain-containing protein [Candidatus Aminicenantia bacterium]